MFITFTARVDAAIGAGLTLTNTVVGAYDSQPGPNPDQRPYTIPTATVPISTGQPAFLVTKLADPSPVAAGGLLTYTILVTNTGIVSATGVVLTDAVPVNTSFVDATAPFAGPVERHRQLAPGNPGPECGAHGDDVRTRGGAAAQRNHSY